MTSGNGADDTPVRLSYTMSIIKFVNGLLDPCQQSTYAMSLHRLAESIDLPSFFVELRHIGTHERLPSLEMLRWSAKKALEWLEVNYWTEVKKSSGKFRAEYGIETDDDSVHVIRRIRCDLDIVREVRLEDPNKIYSHSDTSNSGRKYWYAMDRLTSFVSYDADLLANVMIFQPDGMIVRSKAPNDQKMRSIIYLYRPVLQSLGPEFCMVLFRKLIQFVSSTVFLEASKSANFDLVLAKNDTRFLLPRCKGEVKQAQKWLEYIATKGNILFGSVGFVNETTVPLITQSIGLHNNEHSIALLKFFLQLNEEYLRQIQMTEKVSKVLQTMEKFSLPDTVGLPTKIPKKKLGKDTAVESSVPAHMKRKFDESSTVCLFETYDNWKPVPFGRLNTNK
ncbi:hypothetical protein FOA43_004783 [Brettanomyces nanus]|uniref:Uncharacterized protein n=1 Tax=Eeniella nana TaxID=13502 RepID=A0A875RQL4_EENNA|nr:uncharacterized protein FOA43_004783 [Brettanomyces nanus]QPG77370.1 hypothetical protein FOA43_004783 [Brettanomyces nanus]